MADDSLISDDLLRNLVAVGQVDLLVGLPTHNHAATITEVVRAIDACFRTHFPRQRTVLINSDGGSTDHTPEIVQSGTTGAARTVTTSHGLRSTHRIVAPFRGLPGHDHAVRTILSAADLLQAQTVVLLDPDVDGITPAWIAALASPVRAQGFDFVAPVYERQPGEGLMVTQLLRPLVRACYARRVVEPLAREFGCSGRFAASVAAEPPVAGGAPGYMPLRVTGAALTGAFTIAQAELGPRPVLPTAPRPALSELFPATIAAAFSMIESHADYWLPRTQLEAVPVLSRGAERAAQADLPAPDASRLLASFADDLRNLDEILRRILTPATLEAITTAAGDADAAARFPDPVWAATVAEFLVAYHHGALHRDHIAQALLPLYMARTGVFLTRHATSPPPVVDAALEELGVCFEQTKTQIIDRWAQPAVR